MKPQWIKRTIRLEIATSDWAKLRGPRIGCIEQAENLIHFTCEPWWPPNAGQTLYYLEWIDGKDDTLFHRTLISPAIKAETDKPLRLFGTLHLSPRTGAINTPNLEYTVG
jgi:hypothetical protein